MFKKLYKLIHALIFITLLFGLSHIVNAAPLSNIPKTLTQPNGDVLNCLASGDEYFNYLHDADGNLIIQNPETGYYAYAKLDENSKVTVSDKIASNDTSLLRTDKFDGVKLEDIDFTINSNLISKRFNDRESLLNPVQSSVQASDSGIGITGKKIEGVMENVVIMICFADEDPTISPEAADKVNELFNSDDLSLKSYMKTISNGSLEINSTLVGLNGDTVLMYQDEFPRGYYQPYNEVTNPYGYIYDNYNFYFQTQACNREWHLLEKAVKSINASPLLAGKNLDINGDGFVDSITFIINGNSAEASFMPGLDILWPHQFSLHNSYLYLNGSHIDLYSLQLLDLLLSEPSVYSPYEEPVNSPLSVICHETLHTFGFPDLYRYYLIGADPIGCWDIMASTLYETQFPNSHSRLRYAGWGNGSVEITTNGRYVLRPIGSTDGITSYAIKTSSPNEFILLEYRNKKNESKYDKFFAPKPYEYYDEYYIDYYNNFTEGLTITRINTKYSGNENWAGGYSTNDEVYIYRPNEGRVNLGWGDLHKASLSADFNRTSFGDDTIEEGYNGTIYLYDGTNTRYVISNVSLAGETITFDIKIKDEISEGHAVTFVAGNNGALTAMRNGSPINSGESVTNGESVTFTATPNLNYIVDKWYVNGGEAAENGTVLAIGNFDESKTVVVTFKPNPASIVAAPVINLSSVNYDVNPRTATVTITTDIPDTTIYYTTDGTLPTINPIEYTGAFDISADTEYMETKRIIAYAVKGTAIPSEFVYKDIEFYDREHIVKINNDTPKIGDILTLSDLLINGQSGTNILEYIDILNYEWKANGTQVGTEKTYTVTTADLRKQITLELTVASDIPLLSGALKSRPTNKVEKKAAPVPEIPIFESNSVNSITLKDVQGYEYSLDGELWQSGNVLTGLRAGIHYVCYQRIAETDDTKASMSTLVEAKTADRILSFVADISGFATTFEVLSDGDNPTVQIGEGEFWSQAINSSSSGSLNIPNIVEYNDTIYTITDIGRYAFRECNKLTSVIIPDSVKIINNSSFYGCTSLTTVIIGNSVENIDNFAFFNCDKLTNIVIPDNVKSINHSSFMSCYGLTNVIIGNGIENIGDYVFYRCTNLQSLTIGTNVENIGEYAFYYCRSLQSLVIPDSVKNISNNAFGDCAELKSITIGSGVKNIGDEAFSYTKLKSVTNLAETPQIISDNVFWDVDLSMVDLYVPADSVELYEIAPVWKDFKKPFNIAYIPVIGITNVPMTCIVGKDLTLTGTVSPNNATNKEIVWSIEDAGITGAILNDAILCASDAGIVTVKATIVNGLTQNKDYIQIFNITVINPDEKNDINIFISDAQIEDNLLSVSIDLLNMTDNEISGILVVIVYDGDKMVALKLEDISDLSSCIAVSVRSELPTVLSLGNCTIKVFMWDNMKQMIPLSNMDVKSINTP